MSETQTEKLTAELKGSLGPAGSTVPSETELMERHGLSRTTVRRALKQLENEGLITSSQGSRRKVREVQQWAWPMSTWEAPQHHSDEADAWATAIRKQGGEPHTEVTVRLVPADADIAAALGVAAGSTVVVRERIRSIDGQPHQLADSYFPEWLTNQHPEFLKPGDVSAPGGLLAAAGVPQVRMHDTISARLPTAVEATVLKAKPGVPLVVHTRTGYDEQGRAVRHMVTRAAADRTSISYELLP